MTGLGSLVFWCSALDVSKKFALTLSRSVQGFKAQRRCFGDHELNGIRKDLAILPNVWAGTWEVTLRE